MKNIKLSFTLLILLALIFSLTACSGSTKTDANEGSNGGGITITWWSWLTNIKELAKEYEAEHPNIHIVPVQVPGGAPAYEKYNTVLKAGTGAPDVLQIEYQEVPQFAQTGHLVDVTPYVKGQLGDFSDFSKRLVTYQGKIFGVPIDYDPMGMIYKPDIFNKYGIQVPKTWDEFAAAAAKLHQADPNKYLTFFSPNNGPRMMGLLWQGGAVPFQQLPSGEWKINFTSAKVKKVMNFWMDLINKGYVKVANDFTPQWGNELANGVYAADIGAIWSPTYEIGTYLKPDQYNWKAAVMPQFDPSNPQESMWGGLTFCVTDQSQHAKEAASFAAWLSTNEKAIESNGSVGGLYSASKKFPDTAAFKSKQPVLGGQQENLLFSTVIPTLEKSKFQWSPWTDYAYGQMSEEIPKAIKGDITMDQALANIEANVKDFAKKQGLKVAN
jgi:multiple sugar transport system substrate-binding protein